MKKDNTIFYVVCSYCNPNFVTSTAEIKVCVQTKNGLRWINTYELDSNLDFDYLVFALRSEAEAFIKKCGFDYAFSYGISLDNLIQ